MRASRHRRELQARYRRRAFVYDWICRPLYARARRTTCQWIGQFLATKVEPTLLIEIGCGTGLNFPGLRAGLPPGSHLLGIDWTDAMLRRSRPRAHGVELAQAGPEALVSGQADVVLLAYVLAVTPDWQQVLAQARRLLRPGGALVILDTGRWEGGWRWCNPLLGPLVSWSGHADLDCPWRQALPPTGARKEQRFGGGLVRLWAGQP